MSARGLVSRKGQHFASAISSPRMAAPLLLTGDERFISEDGKARTVYSLDLRSIDSRARQVYDFVLEETYDIENANKRISLVAPLNKEGSHSDDASVDLFSFDLQEINNRYKTAGTGSMTWDSSVCMSLYFAHNPHELKGKIIELGSGVGLGGILSTVAKELSSDADDMSLTCTDVNDEVLDMLEHNMDKAAKSPGLFENDNVHIKKLDWFDFVNNKATEDSKQYDTIIASDCAYLTSQVKPLSETIDKLLGNESKLHMFAPVNRTVVYELTEMLKEAKRMNVQVEDIDLSKNRIKSEHCSAKINESSCGTSRFLHITACRSKTNFDPAMNTGKGTDIYDID